jgi:hypothetical protein
LTPSFSKGTAVSSKEAAPLLKLVGHSEPAVRRALVGLLRPCTVHAAFSEDAVALWVTCATDPDHDVRASFAGEVAALLACRTDTLTTQVRPWAIE